MNTDPVDRSSCSSPRETTPLFRKHGYRPQSSWLKGLSVVVVGTVVAFLVLLGLKNGWLVNTGLWQNHASKLRKTDPSSGVGVTSAVLTVYILFIGGFATLVGFVTKRQGTTAPGVIAVGFVIGAVLVDLWRLIDSIGDLHTAATKRLSYHQLTDNIHDFKAYFILNAIVVAVAVCVACLPPANSAADSEWL